MLVSVTRVGATVQRFSKTVSSLPTGPARSWGAFVPQPVHLGGGVSIDQVPGIPSHIEIATPSSWLGSRAGRDEAIGVLARELQALAEQSNARGEVLLPPGVALGSASSPPAGDTHTATVLSEVEQEVVCNYVRARVPVLIALTGRGALAGGRPVDRTGSRWLAESRSHLATRFLASTAPQHLERVTADLRRRDGVGRLERMDIAPCTDEEGRPAVVLRCFDSASSLAAVRAQSILVAAMVMHARRLVRDGRREGHIPQRRLEENRARAIAAGRRAQFVDDRRTPPGQKPPTVRAAAAIRTFLKELAIEFRNLEVSSEELAPYLLPIELTSLGGTSIADEQQLMHRWLTRDPRLLVDCCRRALTDPALGGPVLFEARAAQPGRVALVLDRWDHLIADAGAETRTNGGRSGDGSRPARNRDRAGGGRSNRTGGGRRQSGNRSRPDGGSTA